MSSLQWKRKLARIWPSQNSKRKIILLYHSVGDTLWGIPRDIFAEQMNWLNEHCHMLSLTDLISSKQNNNIQVAITFDDGYESLHEIVMPDVSKFNIHPTVYLNTGWIGENQRSRRLSDAKLGHYPSESFLTWDEVKSLKEAGWEIGSHGVNHYNFADTDVNITKNELVQSKQEIEKRLSHECLHFAYPWGRYTSNLIRIVRDVGYKFAVAARHGELTNQSNLYAIPRINIDRNYTFDDFKNIILGKWNYLGLIHGIKGL